MGDLRPLHCYFVCATPRSGSTLLCETLSATGVAGRPAEYFETLRSTGLPRQPRQYFDGLLDDPAVQRLGETIPGTPEAPGAFAEHLRAALTAGTTGNGVFGAKVMWGHLPDLAARIKSLPGYERRPTVEALASLFPGVRYVQVLRRDKVAQAVSLWKAVQTRRWRDDGVQERDAELFYSRPAIGHLVDQLTAQEQAWSSWLRTTGQPPLRIVYEEYARAPAANVGDVLWRLGIDAGAARDVPETIMRAQSDALSREWLARFEADEREAVA